MGMRSKNAAWRRCGVVQAAKRGNQVRVTTRMPRPWDRRFRRNWEKGCKKVTHVKGYETFVQKMREEGGSKTQAATAGQEEKANQKVWKKS